MIEASKAFSYSQTLLEEKQIIQSISHMGKCNHNEPIENFFSVMKPESYYGKVYRSYKELDRAIIDYNSLQ